MNLKYMYQRVLLETLDQNGDPIIVKQYGNHDFGIYVQVDINRSRWRIAVDGEEYGDWLK